MTKLSRKKKKEMTNICFSVFKFQAMYTIIYLLYIHFVRDINYLIVEEWKNIKHGKRRMDKLWPSFVKNPNHLFPNDKNNPSPKNNNFYT
jgi:hypothetical protein